MDAFDREEMALQEQLERGEITIGEYNDEIRELQRDYQAMAEESAQRAYDDEMERW
jgi:hypothetical protein